MSLDIFVPSWLQCVLKMVKEAVYEMIVLLSQTERICS
jgi:hypothetical protein